MIIEVGGREFANCTSVGRVGLVRVSCRGNVARGNSDELWCANVETADDHCSYTRENDLATWRERFTVPRPDPSHKERGHDAGPGRHQPLWNAAVLCRSVAPVLTTVRCNEGTPKS